MTDIEVQIRELVADVYDGEGVEIFMNGANAALGGKSPVECIDAGRPNQVLLLVQGLREGVMG